MKFSQKKNNSYLLNLIDLIYDKHHNLLPFLNIFRKDINKLEFKRLGKTETAFISLNNKKFNITVNIDFIEENGLTNEDVLWLICHEISHFILGHLTKRYNEKYSSEFCNIAYDCQVNSMLYNINRRNKISLFEKTNAKSYKEFLSGENFDFSFLLTPPPSKEKVNSDFSKIFYDVNKLEVIKEFWFENYSEHALSLDKIFYYLEQILPQDKTERKPKESEPSENEKGEKPADELPESALEIFELLENEEEEKADVEIFQSAVEEMINREFDFAEIDFEKRKQNVLKQAVLSVFIDENTKGAKEENFVRQSSVFPAIARKEAVMLAENYLPAFYNNALPSQKKKLLAVYIDFSASTEPYHAEIIALINSIKNVYDGNYFAFSNDVSELSIEEINEGNFASGGTNITSVVEHVNQNRFNKVLVITDGEFASPKEISNAEFYFILFDENDSIDSVGDKLRVKKVWSF